MPRKTPSDRTDYQIRQILKYNRDGSPAKQRARHQTLMRCVMQWQARGYGQRWDIHKLDAKDVHRLVDDWRTQQLSSRTIANNLVHIRWLASKIGREDRIPTNRQIGVGLRKNTPGWGENKSRELDRDRLAAIPQREQLVTELRREFGLRTEEAVKFQYRYACRQEGKVQLQKSWCKGGRPRTIPIVNERQRNLLERVARFQLANRDRSMIPNHRTFRGYRKEYDDTIRRAGIPGHALRHAWAQARFEQIAGFAAPHAGGPKYSEMDEADRERWNQAAAVVNRELGHGEGRQDITSTYIGARE